MGLLTIEERDAAARLLVQVQAHGGRITNTGDSFTVKARTVFPIELLRELKAHTPAVLAALTCATCGLRPIPPHHRYRCAVCATAAGLVVEHGRPPYIVTEEDIADALRRG